MTNQDPRLLEPPAIQLIIAIASQGYDTMPSGHLLAPNHVCVLLDHIQAQDECYQALIEDAKVMAEYINNTDLHDTPVGGAAKRVLQPEAGREKEEG